MPIAKLSTGINLYYESYGRGEAIVFIPGTGFAGNVWIESQAEELARSHQVIVHDPRGRTVNSCKGCLYDRRYGQ